MSLHDLAKKFDEKQAALKSDEDQDLILASQHKSDEGEPEDARVWDVTTDGLEARTSVRTFQSSELPVAIWEIQTTRFGWYLAKVSDRYEFPFKVYGTHKSILERIQKAWANLDGNLGILLNGSKGAGKTVIAQEIGNWALDNGYPVLAVSSPAPDILPIILNRVPQPMVLIFDEFEKTHPTDNHGNGTAQETLLTTLDGMTRTKHKRLFLFTTNTPQVNQNLIDRPSRIRYFWTFTQLSDEVIDELLDDLLKPELNHLRLDVLGYIKTRNLRTLDAVKCAINEVNIFEESPTKFDDFLNLSENADTEFAVTILDEEGNEVRKHAPLFEANSSMALQLCRGLESARDFIRDRHRHNHSPFEITCGKTGRCIDLIAPGPYPMSWIANLQTKTFNTWVGVGAQLKEICHSIPDYLWNDKPPEGWKPPLITKDKGEDGYHDQVSAAIDWSDSQSIHGTEDFETYLIKIQPKNTLAEIGQRKKSLSLQAWDLVK